MNATQTNKIQDIDEFTKLFKLNIPVHSEFDYYFNLIKNSKEYNLCEMDRKLRLFCDLEEFAKEKGYESAYRFKMREIDRLKEIIIQSKAYKKLIELELPKSKTYSRDWLNQVSDGEYLLSLDFVSANYSVLKTFDSDNEICYSWAEFCKIYDVHEALAISKSFRQVVFGNTSPKRLSTFQHNKIMKIIDYLKSCGWEDDEFVFISHDEIVLKIKGPEDVENIQNSYEQIKVAASGMDIKPTVFSLKKIKKNIFIKTIFDVKSDLMGFGKLKLFFKQSYSKLHGVPGNKFFYFYKKYILEQPLDERDLVFMLDGEVCKFVDEDVIKKQKIALPHYEKLKYSLTIEDAKNDYSYVWNKMTEIIPNMSEEEKRRVVEIIANTCHHCNYEPIGCQCWNDD